MPNLLPLAIPKGMYKNGTDYQGARRWVDGNLFRWNNDAASPIGGWQRLYSSYHQAYVAPVVGDTATEAVRNMFTWRTNAGVVQIVVGTNTKLAVIDPAGIITDITPVGFTVESRRGGINDVGFGTGVFGAETYGTPRERIADASVNIATWVFATWGENLIAKINKPGQPIYEWVPGSARAVAVPNAPSHGNTVVVTDQRIMVSLGSTDEARLVEWSDSEDNTDWTPQAVNQAGSKLLEGIGRIVAAANVGKDILIITETDVHVMRYIGPPYIFGFSKVASGTSILGVNTVAQALGTVFWLGRNKIWAYSGGQVMPIPCEVMDHFSWSLRREFAGKITCHVLSAFDEIWWYYQSIDSLTDEPDRYLVYNYVQNIFYTGTLDRVAGIDATEFTRPMKVSSDGTVYLHEIPGVVSDPPSTFLETGMFEADTGGNVLYISKVHHDVQEVIGRTAGAATFSLIARDTQTGTPREYGPFDLGEPRSVRARGRYIKLKVQATESSPSNIGIFKLEATVGGPQ